MKIAQEVTPGFVCAGLWRSPVGTIETRILQDNARIHIAIFRLIRVIELLLVGRVRQRLEKCRLLGCDALSHALCVRAYWSNEADGDAVREIAK